MMDMKACFFSLITPFFCCWIIQGFGIVQEDGDEKDEDGNEPSSQSNEGRRDDSLTSGGQVQAKQGNLQAGSGKADGKRSKGPKKKAGRKSKSGIKSQSAAGEEEDLDKILQSLDITIVSLFWYHVKDFLGICIAATILDAQEPNMPLFCAGAKATSWK